MHRWLDGKCPKWVDYRARAEGQQRFLYCGSSVLRYGSDTAETRFDVIPGAKVGHVANHIENDQAFLPKVETLVVVAGQNQRRNTAEEMRSGMKMETEQLAKVLRPFRELDPPKDIFLVDPVVGPALEGEEGGEMRFLRNEVRRCAAQIGAEFVNLEEIRGLGDEDMDDDVHWSRKGTERILKVVRDEVIRKTGKNSIPEMIVSNKPYTGVRHHHKVGCHTCTFYHLGRACPAAISTRPPTETTQGSVSAAAVEILEQEGSSSEEDSRSEETGNGTDSSPLQPDGSTYHTITSGTSQKTSTPSTAVGAPGAEMSFLIREASLLGSIPSIVAELAG